MGSLPTSQEIYDRIRWDPGLDESLFTIGYEDREQGLQEVPFSCFIPGGDVPWHRIQYFRMGETVVWDRRTRTDLLSTLEQTPAGPERGRE